MNKVASLIIGTFNPITNAHMKLGRIAKEYDKASDVYFVPANNAFLHSWKGYNNKDVFDDELRIKLLNVAFEDSDFKVFTGEIDGIVDGRTINTVKYFKDVLKYDSVNIIMGKDKINEIDYWYKAAELKQIANIVIVDRKTEDEISIRKESDFIFISQSDDELLEVSSTKVREALRNNDYEYAKSVLPEGVYNYCVAHRLKDK